MTRVARPTASLGRRLRRVTPDSAPSFVRDCHSPSGSMRQAHNGSYRPLAVSA